MPGSGGRFPVRSRPTRNRRRIASWFVVTLYRLHIWAELLRAGCVLTRLPAGLAPQKGFPQAEPSGRADDEAGIRISEWSVGDNAAIELAFVWRRLRLRPGQAAECCGTRPT